MPTELQLLLSGALGAIGGMLLEASKGYLSKKGENLATKEDIGKITEIVEQARELTEERLLQLEHDLSRKLEGTRHQNTLALASIDRRLEAHQQAYKLLVRARETYQPEQQTALQSEMKEWMLNNCVYLTKKSFVAMFDCYYALIEYWMDRADLRGVTEKAERDVLREGMRKNKAILQNGPNIILAEVELPPIALRDERPGADRTEQS